MMMKFIFLCLLFGICFENSLCGPNRGSSSQSRTSFVGRRNSYIGHNIPSTTTTTTTQGPLTPKEFLQAKGTFSAFTLILVIILGTILCLGFYYSIICYPLIFRTEKNYQFMDVSSTMTSATSRSIQSIENFTTGKSLDNYPTSEKSIETYPSSAAIVSEKHINEEFIHQHHHHHPESLNNIVSQKH